MNELPGISFVIPLHNGAASIADTLRSVAAQADGRPVEIIVVDDRSSDTSRDIVRQFTVTPPIRLFDSDGRGAAAALNIGVRAATFQVVCQVDQDVVLGEGWMTRLAAQLDDPSVGAAQGYYATDGRAPVSARVMGLDLEMRYASISGADTDHVCTGNSAYRREPLLRVGLFDEAFGYGCDNDMSYRLREAGYRLTLCREARSTHRWREGLWGYLVQQYGFGYGRLDVVAKHPKRFGGDAVSPPGMMWHPLVLAIGVVLLGAAALGSALGLSWSRFALAGGALIASLAIERTVAAARAFSRFGDPAAFAFPFFHLLRDGAWVAAIATWGIRRLRAVPPSPAHSMRRGVEPVEPTDRQEPSP